MSSQPQAWKILGLTTAATPIEVGAAVDRLRRAWEPLISHSDTARRALGARKLREITSAYQAIQALESTRRDDWSERMVFLGRLPDGTWGDRLKYLKEVHEGVTPTPGLRIPALDESRRAARRARLVRGSAVTAFVLLRRVLQTLRVLSWVYVAALVALFFYADYRHQEQLHAVAEARASQQAASLQGHPSGSTAEANEPVLAPLPSPERRAAQTDDTSAE